MASTDTPYATGFLSSKITHDLDTVKNFEKIKKEEKGTHQAIAQLPYELSSLPKYYADMVNSALDAYLVLENILRSDNIENRKELEKLKNNTGKTIEYFVKNVDVILDKFAIRANLPSDE